MHYKTNSDNVNEFEALTWDENEIGEDETQEKVIVWRLRDMSF